PVAAHLGRRTVGVAVVHEPLGGVGGRLDPGGAGADRADDAVAADAAPPIAQGGDRGGVQLERAVGVVEEDEVVAGAVPGGEVDARGHGTSLRGPWPPSPRAASIAAAARSVTSSPPASIQWTRSSRANQVSCF